MFTKILVGYDGSSGGKLALTRAASLAKLVGLPVTALWVKPPQSPCADLPSQLTKEIAAVSADIGIPISTETIQGQVARALSDYARAGGFDLIALGQNPHPPSEGTMLGDVADCVSNIAHCSVLIVKL
jgi:nucleotide-binding universal stress UspA family protein